MLKKPYTLSKPYTFIISDKFKEVNGHLANKGDNGLEKFCERCAHK